MYKKNIILIFASIFIFVSTLFNVGTVNASEELPKEKVELIEQQQIVVRRQYIDVFIQHFIASSAPNTYWYSRGGFSGNLNLYHEEERNDGTVNGFYRGYIYNDDYPIPLTTPIKSSSSWGISETITKDNVHEFPSTISVNNSSYRGILTLEELWQNQDSSWTGIYRGTVTSGNTPLEIIEEK